MFPFYYSLSSVFLFVKSAVSPVFSASSFMISESSKMRTAGDSSSSNCPFLALTIKMIKKIAATETLQRIIKYKISIFPANLGKNRFKNN
ncbi:hypothetical protein FIC_00147 [Flavobacteriaceae bacterium 3519-10]|nr:hypothetical protein FIC_00147 [Flavobacteriaceae bacterium 3519-10]